MRTRTCTHNVFEIFSEIILNNSFIKKYKLLEKVSVYNGNFYCNIFSDNDFKRKLLIIDKISNKIVFENLTDDTFVTFNDITKDAWIYSIDRGYGRVIKFRNPYLLSCLQDNIDEEFNCRFPSIILSDELLCLTLTDDYLSFGLIIKSLEASIISDADFRICENDIITIDKIFQVTTNQDIALPIQKANYRLSSAGALLMAINVNNGQESYREFFPDSFDLNINKNKIKKGNCILVEYYDGYFMTPIERWIDLKENKSFQLTYPGMTLYSDNYFITIPSFDYNTFTNFLLFRVSDLSYINLTDTILPIIKIAIEDVSIADIELTTDGVLRINDFEFNCSNLFSGVINKTPYDYKQNIHSFIPITSNLFSGFALSTHTIKSKLLANGNFETERTEIGEQLYQLKYNFNKQMLLPLAEYASRVIKDLFKSIDVIIPIPPTNTNRPFQPVIELAYQISRLTGIKCNSEILIKNPTQAIKSVDDNETRKNILKNAFRVSSNDLNGKNILLFDDLYRSGDTLDAAAKILKEKGEVAGIFVLTLTKTRTKK